jgi:hypothetical protein
MSGAVIAAQSRNPLASLQATQAKVGIHAALDTDQLDPVGKEGAFKGRKKAGHSAYFLGTVQRRQAVRLRAVQPSAPEPHHCDAQGNVSVDVDYFAEAALFPALFPQGKGSFQAKHATRGSGFFQYLQQRLQQMFQLFTLIPEYALTMVQVSLYLFCFKSSCTSRVHRFKTKL